MQTCYTSAEAELDHVEGLAVVNNVIKCLQNMLRDPLQILSATTDFFGEDLKLDQDSTLKCLRSVPVHKKFQEMLSSCLQAIIIVLERQYSRYFSLDLTEKLRQETASTRLHNIDSEEMVGMFSGRLSSIRGPIKYFISDNGTNLTSAEKELKENIKQLNSQETYDKLLNIGIQWKFNPPKASNFGGVWERLIRSIRRILNALMKKSGTRLMMKDHTLICEAEKIINSRPLTVSSDDITDLNPITPAQITLKSSNNCHKPNVAFDNDMYSRRRWKRVQYLADVFWSRWKREYVVSTGETNMASSKKKL
ncbi:hypothetical protein GQR58_011831 [Nymphon striatum]|nr:hypothetical protein GQR58_011831 [Nymphon striatum]